MTERLPLALSTGDPAGVGPTVAVRAAREHARPVLLFGDAGSLRTLALAEGVPAARLVDLARGKEASLPRDQRHIGLVHVADWPPDRVAAHAPDAELGRAQLAQLDAAADAVQRGAARAVVTAPTSKSAITASGVPFVGQTEHLARRAGLADDAVTMLFLGPRLRTALVTTHLALANVPSAITEARVVRAAGHLAEALARLGVERPTIAVAGLNPHAGEGGMFGDEEAQVIAPAVARLRAAPPFVEGRAELVGVVGAETAFRRAADGLLAGVVAMYHDQATIASKLLDWGEAVNVTWGLPFVRTSVDHGVAYDAARDGAADASGMIAAVALAEVLAR